MTNKLYQLTYDGGNTEPSTKLFDSLFSAITWANCNPQITIFDAIDVDEEVSQ